MTVFSWFWLCAALVSAFFAVRASNKGQTFYCTLFVACYLTDIFLLALSGK